MSLHRGRSRTKIGYMPKIENDNGPDYLAATRGHEIELYKESDYTPGDPDYVIETAGSEIANKLIVDHHDHILGLLDGDDQ